ncbi:MAG: hypothetical protein ACP5KY_08005 [Thermoproteus sp.]
MKMRDMKSRTGRGSPTAAIFLAVFLAIVVGGLVLLGAWHFFGGQLPAAIQQPQQTVVAPQAQTQAPPGRLQLQVQDVDTGSALSGDGSSTWVKIDIVDPADLTKPKEVVQVDTSTKVATSGLFYNPGQRLLLHVSSNVGNGYYPAVFEVVVPSTYTLQGNQYVYFLGAFGIKQRAAAAGVAYTLFRGATVLSSATGSAPDGTADLHSAGTKVVDMTLQINLNDYRVSYGRPVDYITYKFDRTQLRLVAWIGFNNTAISATALTALGWTPVTSTAFTGWQVYYKVLDPAESSQTALGSLAIPIKMDATSLASNTDVKVYVWVADLQNPTDAASGISWSSLPAYGAYSTYGISSPIGRAFAVSGSTPSSPLLQAVIRVA